MSKPKQLVDLLPELRAHVAREFKTQTAAAKHWGCSRAYLSFILNGKKAAPDWILESAGIERIKTTAYVRK